VEVITALLEGYGQGGSGNDPALPDEPYWSTFLIADASQAWHVETSGEQWQAEQVTRSRAISNRTSIATFDAAHRNPRQQTERFVDARLAAGTRLLADEPVTVPSLCRHLRSHDSHAPGEDGWSVCMHVPDTEATTASMVAELVSDGRPSRAWMLLGSPCRSLYIPVRVGEPFVAPEWERFAALADMWSDERAAAIEELEVWLAAECPPAEETWRLVDETLTRLGSP
jgi:secernin